MIEGILQPHVMSQKAELGRHVKSRPRVYYLSLLRDIISWFESDSWVIKMTDRASFHERTKSCKHHGNVRSTTYWVGVLHSSKKSRERDLENGDFQWIKCKATTDGHKIREQYLLKYPNEDVVFMYDHRKLDLSRSMKDLDDYGDKLVALEAVLTLEVEEPQPLRLRNFQTSRRGPRPVSRNEMPTENDKHRTTDVPIANTSPSSKSPGPGIADPTVSTISPADQDFTSASKSNAASESPNDPKQEFLTSRARSGSSEPLQNVRPLKSPELDCPDCNNLSFQLQTAFEDAAPEKLELCVSKGIKLIERLKASLLNLPGDPNAVQWIQHIGKPSLIDL